MAGIRSRCSRTLNYQLATGITVRVNVDTCIVIVILSVMENVAPSVFDGGKDTKPGTRKVESSNGIERSLGIKRERRAWPNRRGTSKERIYVSIRELPFLFVSYFSFISSRQTSLTSVLVSCLRRKPMPEKGNTVPRGNKMPRTIRYLLRITTNGVPPSIRTTRLFLWYA